MPIYEYLCQKCGRHFEKRQSVSDEPLTECEKCGGQLEKQWSLSGFQFKGEGWYVTDYSKKPAAKDEKSSSSSEKTSSSESTASTDSASKSTSDKSAK